MTMAILDANVYDESGYWLYGFRCSEEARAQALAQFARFGEIIRHKFQQAEGTRRNSQPQNGGVQ